MGYNPIAKYIIEFNDNQFSLHFDQASREPERTH